jgi:subtilisin family serine protease
MNSQLIVQLEEWQQEPALYTMIDNITDVSVLSKKLKVYQVTVASTNRGVGEREMRTVRVKAKAAQKNFGGIQARGSPSDEHYNVQWNIKDSKFDKIYGKVSNHTSTGDKIVCAVIDKDFSFNNHDLQTNLAANSDGTIGYDATIDANGIVTNYGHGTSVLGIIGATSDNGIGVFGAGMNCQVLPIDGYADQTAIIRAFNHVLEARDLYNKTKGKEGRLITAVNCSFGVNYGRPDQFPVWCNMIEAVGEVGVLVICATTNHMENVDYYLDMPTSLVADCMISVTAHDKSSEISAGHGTRSIHIAAPGKRIMTIGKGDSEYVPSNGTSMAAPLVTALTSLLYSLVPADRFSAVYDSPVEMAQKVKQHVLNSASSLVGKRKTISNGKLDAEKAVESFHASFQPVQPVQPKHTVKTELVGGTLVISSDNAPHVTVKMDDKVVTITKDEKLVIKDLSKVMNISYSFSEKFVNIDWKSL